MEALLVRRQALCLSEIGSRHNDNVAYQTTFVSSTSQPTANNICLIHQPTLNNFDAISLCFEIYRVAFSTVNIR